MIKRIAIITIIVLIAILIYFLTTPYYEVRSSYVAYDTDNQYFTINKSSKNKIKFNFWYNGDFEKSYNLENHKLGNNWSLVFEDESKDIKEVEIESVSLIVDGEILSVNFKHDPMKFGASDKFEGVVASQVVTLKKVPEEMFVIKITGILTTKYGMILPFSHAQTGKVDSMSSYYSGFNLLMPTV